MILFSDLKGEQKTHYDSLKSEEEKASYLETLTDALEIEEIEENQEIEEPEEVEETIPPEQLETTVKNRNNLGNEAQEELQEVEQEEPTKKKNNFLLYGAGLLGIGAIAYLYFLNKPTAQKQPEIMPESSPQGAENKITGLE